MDGAAAPAGHLPIRRLIALFVVLTAVPLALLAFFSVRLASQAVEEQVRTQVRSTAAVSATVIEKELQGLVEVVEAYASRRLLVRALEDRRHVDEREVRRHLLGLRQSRPGIATAFVADDEGRLIDILPETPSIVGRDFSFRDWYDGVTRTGRAYVSHAYRSAVAGRPRVVAVAVPIRAHAAGADGAGRVGVLVAAYGLETIQRFVDDFGRSQGVLLGVADQDGRLIAAPRGLARGLPSVRNDPSFAAALSGEPGVTVRETEAFGSLLAASVPVPGLGWAVVAAVSEHAALAPVRRLRTTVLAVTAVLALVLVGGLAVLGRTLRARRRAELAAERSRADAERTRAEAERMHAEAERAREEAEQANVAKSEFLSRMSHELRTPLNAVLGFGQLLALDGLRPDQRESVDQILKAGRHLLSLIDEVLDISRIEAGQLSLSIEPVSVADTVSDVLQLAAPLAAERRIALTGSGDSEYALADRQRLKQILLNLVSNAIKYNRDGGSVDVSVTSADGRVRVAVADTGVGIAPERLDRLFAPFERLGAEHTGLEGTGLGLALSKRLAEAMGGGISVESTAGEGTTFWVELAAAEAEPPQADDAAAAPRASTDGGSGGDERLVLYVEDNLSNLKLVERVLAHRPEVRLLPAMQGRIGLELAREHRPDLILLDVHLPDLAGDDLLVRLRAEPETSEIPVVVLSADATERQIERLLDKGASDYLTKPLDVERFLEVLDEHLEPSRTVDGPTPHPVRA